MWPRRVARVFLQVYVAQTVLAFMPAHAQVESSRGAAAGMRPIIDAAQNGTAVVHIAPPTAAGVSRNQYQQFNVDAKGLILNNSSSNVQTQTGGWISGNPQLGRTPARVIVNEVVGSGASRLAGTIEVAGRSAEVVVANPNGLVCDGCNFLNSSRGTLSTGTAVYGGQGALQGFSVRQGQLTIGRGGLNAANLEQLDLIARGLVVDGEVWAQNLRALAGAAIVSHAAPGEVPTVEAQAGTGPKPRFAIDITALGGMVGNQVYMVATELGLGVNSTGRTAALQGNLHLSANGDLTIGEAYAKETLSVDAAGNAVFAGATQSEGATRVDVGGSLTNRGLVQAGSGLSIQAGSIFNSGDVVAHEGTASLRATGDFGNSGSIESVGTLSVLAGSLSNSGSMVGHSVFGDALALASIGPLANSGSLRSAGGLSLRASRVSDVGGTVQAEGALAVEAQALLLDGSAYAAGQSVALVADSVASRDASVLAGGELNVVSRGELRNSGGRLMGRAGVTVDASTLVNESSHAGVGVAGAGAGAGLGASASAGNQGSIISDASVVVRTRGADQAGVGLSNQGLISAKESLTVDSGTSSVINRGGVMVANGSLSVRANVIDNSGGEVVSLGAAGGAVSLAAARLGNVAGTLSARQLAINVGSGAIDNAGGEILVAG
ncbi:hypothetical protein BH09PSE5_BH09PSE5_20250 [soil metagenome]